jgi:hypothetical protein
MRSPSCVSGPRVKAIASSTSRRSPLVAIDQYAEKALGSAARRHLLKPKAKVGRYLSDEISYRSITFFSRILS